MPCLHSGRDEGSTIDAFGVGAKAISAEEAFHVSWRVASRLDDSPEQAV